MKSVDLEQEDLFTPYHHVSTKVFGSLIYLVLASIMTWLKPTWWQFIIPAIVIQIILIYLVIRFTRKVEESEGFRFAWYWKFIVLIPVVPFIFLVQFRTGDD